MTRASLPITVRTTFTTLDDTEVFAPTLARVVNEAGSHPSSAIAVTLGSGAIPADIYNCLFHDVSDCFLGSEAPGGTVDGSLYYNNGWMSTMDRPPDGGHGYNWYTQNLATSPPKILKRSILSAAFLLAKFLTTGADTDKLHHLILSQNIFEGGEFLIGSQAGVGADDIQIDDCAFLEAYLEMGYLAPNGICSITNSLLARKGISPYPNGCVVFGNGNGTLTPAWQHVTFRNNTLVAGKQAGAVGNAQNAWNRLIVIYKTPLSVVQSWDVDYNTYYSKSAKPFNLVGVGAYSFAEWQALTGLDRHSTFINGEPPTPIIKRFELPDLNRIHLAVVNPAALATIRIPDDLYSATIREIRNYPNASLGDQLVMSGDVARPLNWPLGLYDPPLAPPTFPFYGAFILEDVMTFQQQVDALNAQISALQQQVSGLQTQYNTDTASLNAQIATLTSQNGALTTKINAVRTFLQGVGDSINTFLATF